MSRRGALARSTGAVRVGLVGCGRIAQSHLEALDLLPEARLAAVVEVRPGAAQAVAERYDCPHFEDFADPGLPELLDAVIVCTPPSTHFGIARHFLANGVPVLSEKPLVIDPREADELLELSENHNAVLMMASKFRYVEDVIKAKAFVDSGILGKVVMYENSFCSRVSMGDRWNARKAIAGGGVLIDNGSHSVDIARYLLGPIQEVLAQTSRSVQDLEVEDTARVQFRARDGVLGSIDLSWTINKEQPYFISVYGTEGTLQVGWKGSQYRLEGRFDWVSFGNGYIKTDALRRQLENFIAVVKRRENPLITTLDALASVRVVETAYRSAADGRWVRVE